MKLFFGQYFGISASICFWQRAVFQRLLFFAVARYNEFVSGFGKLAVRRRALIYRCYSPKRPAVCIDTLYTLGSRVERERVSLMTKICIQYIARKRVLWLRILFAWLVISFSETRDRIIGFSASFNVSITIEGIRVQYVEHVAALL